MIGVTGLDPLSLAELGGEVQCFGKFGASGRARTIKIGRRVRELNRNWLDKDVLPDSTIWGAEGRGRIGKIEIFFTYEGVIGS